MKIKDYDQIKDYDPADPSRNIVTRYTCGDCAQLAYAVEQLTGWPAYGYHQGGGIDVHVFNLLPNGMRLDINGPRYKRLFDAEWKRFVDRKSMRIKRVVWDEVHRTWGDQTPTPPTERIAAKLVAYVKGQLDSR